MKKMPRIALNNGVQVPLLGLGTFLLKSPEVLGATEAALNLGYRLIGSPGMKPDDLKNAELRKESWLKLEYVYKEGKFKAIGISNYTKYHIQELLQYCSVVPAVLQIEVHPYLTQKEIRKFCNEKGIHVQAYSFLGSRSGCKESWMDPAQVDETSPTYNVSQPSSLWRLLRQRIF